MNNNKKERDNYEYVGIFSGLQFLRTPVKALMAKHGIGSSAIIHVQKVGKNESGNAHSYTITKKVRKGRKQIEVQKTIYFTVRFTGYDAWHLSLPPIPCRITDEWGDEWTIPQSARIPEKKKSLNRKPARHEEATIIDNK